MTNYESGADQPDENGNYGAEHSLTDAERAAAEASWLHDTQIRDQALTGVAKRMLGMGMDAETIGQATGYLPEFVQKLGEEMREAAEAE